MTSNKNKFKPNPSRGILFVAASLIIIVFLWYFLFYIKSKEEILIQKNFRVLTQLGENFKNKYNGYCSIIKSTDMQNACDKLKYNDEAPEILITLDQKKDYIKKYFSGLEIVDTAKKHDENYIYFSEADSALTEKIIYVANDTLFIKQIQKITNDSLKTENIINKLKSGYNDTSLRRLFTNFSLCSSQKENIINSIKNKLHTSFVEFRLDKKTFFKPLQRKDIFNEIIIIVDPTNKSQKTRKELFFSSFQGDIVIESLDSLVKENRGIISGSVADGKILGIDYKLFFTHVKLKNGQSYFIGGVINEERYDRETRAINSFVTLLMVIIFFTFLLGIPLIKLRFLSENQNLTTSDLIFSTLSLLIGTFFIILIIFSILNYSREKGKVSDSLHNLSNSIDNSLNAEIKNIYSTLEKYRDTVNENTNLPDLEKPDWPYNFFKLIFKLDSSGTQKYIINSRNKHSTPGNYSYRKYFTNSGEWDLEGKKLMLDFIYSHSSGEQLGVVSIKEGNSVYAITSRFYSVINTITPPGYGFCIIDKTGDVKFHSDATKMLRENFIKESDNPGGLAAAIYGNLKCDFSANYLGRNHSCYIKPFSTLPLYIVTFFDDSYAYSLSLQVTIQTIIFLFLILLMFLISIIVSRIVVYRKSELKRSFDLVDWLRPALWKMPMYRGLIITNIIAIIFIIISWLLFPGLEIISIIIIFIPLQLLAALIFTDSVATKSLNKKYSRIQYVPLTFFILLIIIIFFKTNANHIFINILIIICSFIPFIVNIFLIRKGASPSICKEFKQKTEFCVYLFSWLIFVVVTPTIIFSIIFFNNEEISDLKYTLHSYATKESIRNYEIDKFYDNYVKYSFLNYRDSRKIKGVYYIHEIKREKDSTEYNMRSSLDAVLNDLIPNLDTLATLRRSLAHNFGNPSDDIISYKYTPFQVYHSNTLREKTIYYTGTRTLFGFNTPEAFIILILLLVFLLSLFLIFKLIQFTTERIFGISINEKDEPFSDLLEGYLKSGNNLIIQYAGLYEKDLDINNIDKENKNSKSMELLKRYESEKKISSFCFSGMQKTDEKKLELINWLLKNGSDQIVIISNKSIEKLIEDYKENIKQKTEQSKKDNEKDNLELQKLNNYVTSLENINRYFIHLYAPLNENATIVEWIKLFYLSNKKLDNLDKAINKEFIKLDDKGKEELVSLVKPIGDELENLLVDPARAIREEKEKLENLVKIIEEVLKKLDNKSKEKFEKLISEKFLDQCFEEKNYKQKKKFFKANLNNQKVLTIIKEAIVLGLSYRSLKEYYDILLNEKSIEKIILKIQKLATDYYEHLWESCTKEEKLLLLDISDNLLLNDKNKLVIETLINKGLLKKDISVDIMNQSFRNYINSKSLESYEEEYLEIRKTGKWEYYRAPIMLSLFAAAIFLYFQGNILAIISTALVAVKTVFDSFIKISGEILNTLKKPDANK